MKNNSQYKLCKNDIILAAVLAAAAVALAVIFFLIPEEKQGNIAVVTIEGMEYGRYSLSKDQTVEISNEKGHNTLIIKDSKAYMEEADCPDGYCIYRGNISTVGETIVCLPHRLVVEIISGDDDAQEEFDVIAE